MLLGLISTAVSCNTDPKKPGWAYFPDMVYSQAYETYSPNPNFADGQTARPPVAGTIARGALPSNPAVDDEEFEKSYLFKRYYPETPEGYEAAGAELKNPITLNDQSLADGKKVFQTKHHVLDVSLLSNGIYFLKINSKDVSFIKKIIVLHN